MATIKASRLVGTLSQVSFLTTSTMILVITIRISTASRMAERTAGMYCRMVSMVMSSLNFYFTAPPRAHSSASRLGNVL